MKGHLLPGPIYLKCTQKANLVRQSKLFVCNSQCEQGLTVKVQRDFTGTMKIFHHWTMVRVAKLYVKKHFGAHLKWSRFYEM